MRAAVVIGLAVALDMGIAAPVLGAIAGSATPAAAQPGDPVVLTTDAPAGPHTYDNLAAAGPTPIYLQLATATSAGNDCSTPVGQMTWSGGVGTLRFLVPAVPAGTYWILAGVQGGCWRFGAAEGILTLTVLPGPTSIFPAALVLVVIAAAAAGLVALFASRRTHG